MSSVNSMFAVIKFQGHQYLVGKGQRLRVDRILSQGGKTVCQDVYCLFDDELISLGTPMVKGASVVFSIIGQVRGKKAIAFKYRPKARSRVKKGFKPEYTDVKIAEIKP